MMKFIRILTALSLFVPGIVLAQGAGQLQPGQVWGNPTASKAPATGSLIGPLLDQGYTCTGRGSLLVRGATLWSCFAPSATANTPLLSKGTGADLAYGAFSLPTSVTSGGIPCFTSTTAMTSSALLTASAILLGGGAGVCPSALGSLGTTTTLLHGNAAGAPTFGQVVFADIATAAVATASQYLAGTASTLVPASVIYTAETTTTFGSTTTFDFSTFINTAVTLTNNITTQTLSNVTAGKSGHIRFIQDGTGSRTTVWNSIFKFAGGATPTLTTTANAIDVLWYDCATSSLCYASLSKDMK